MKIVDILIQSAELIGLVSENEILSNATIETENEILQNQNIKSLFNLAKYSIQELCTNYMPVNASENVQTVSKRYEVGKLKNFIRVNNILKDGVVVNYKIINRNLTFAEDGIYTVNYSSYPEILSIFDEIDFLENFSPDVIVLGLSAYYTLSRGLFEDFEIYHEQYVEKANSLKELKMFSMPQRSWQWEQKKELK